MSIIAITGYSGFVGTNLTKYQGITSQYDTYAINLRADTEFEIPADCISVIHLAGKAHDLKKISTPDEYYYVNTRLTQKVYDKFVDSDAKVFIMLSSVKASADEIDGALTEEMIPNPQTHYGNSKLLAEQYILNNPIPSGKKFFILRPCMIHGPGNKGNLNLLFKMASKNIPWPLSSFQNQRSFLTVENLCFVIKELIEREEIPSGIYNVADDTPLSTNSVIEIISETISRKPRLWKINQSFIRAIARAGDFLPLPLNSERLKKLTESYVVSNAKLKLVIKKPLPVNSEEGLRRTIQSFMHEQ